MERVQSVDELKSRHAALESMLNTEADRPMPNQVTVQQIKREKLKIKDLIAEIERG